MKLRHLLTAAGLALAAVVFAGQIRILLADPTIWPPDDFVEYWAAARLTLDGQNPYDPNLLLPLQRAAGRDTDEAIMMWNPPSSVAVVLPLGALDARPAQLLWLAVNLVTILFCGDRLWLMLGGSRSRRWIGSVVGLAFLPSLFALQSGQISPLVLLGGVLFLECRRRGWPFLAGVATLLLAIKPHLVYLVWVAILCEAVVRRQFAVIAGGLIAGVVAVLVVLPFNPQLLHQYADAMGNRPPSQWVTLTIGTLLRLAFGAEYFRLQFISVALGLAWFAWHWRKHAHQWDWTEQFPLLLLVSFITTPYGAWPFDMVLFLPAVVRLVADWERGWLTRPGLVLGGLVAVNLACLVMNLFGARSFSFIWVTPAVLVLYLIGNRNPSPRTDAEGTPAVVPA